MILILMVAFGFLIVSWWLDQNWRLLASIALLSSIGLALWTGASSMLVPAVDASEIPTSILQDAKWAPLMSSMLASVVTVLCCSFLSELAISFGVPMRLRNWISGSHPFRVVATFGLVAFLVSAFSDPLLAVVMVGALLVHCIENRESRAKAISVTLAAGVAGSVFTSTNSVFGMEWLSLPLTSFLLCTLFALFVWIGPAAWLTWNNTAPGRLESSQSDFRESCGLILLLMFSGTWITVFGFRWLGLPNFVGVLLVTSIAWIVSDFLERRRDITLTTTMRILQGFDLKKTVFLLGLLLFVGVVTSESTVTTLATVMKEWHRIPRSLTLGCLAGILDVRSLGSLLESASTVSLVEHTSLVSGQLLFLVGSVAGMVVFSKGWISFRWYTKQVLPPMLASFMIGLILVWSLQTFLFAY